VAQGLRTLGALGAVALVLSGCPDPGGGGGGDDGGTDPPDGRAPGEPWVTIGTGGLGTYEELSDGDTAYLARGCQGGQHVWISLRAGRLDTMPALIQLRAQRERDEMDVSIPFQVRLTFEPVPEEEYDQLTGLQLVIPNPEEVLGEEVVIRARVSENVAGGASAEDERHVVVEWGDEVCGGMGPDGGPDPNAMDGGAPLGDGGEPGPDAGAGDDGGPEDGAAGG